MLLSPTVLMQWEPGDRFRRRRYLWCGNQVLVAIVRSVGTAGTRNMLVTPTVPAACAWSLEEPVQLNHKLFLGFQPKMYLCFSCIGNKTIIVGRPFLRQINIY